VRFALFVSFRRGRFHGLRGVDSGSLGVNFHRVAGCMFFMMQFIQARLRDGGIVHSLWPLAADTDAVTRPNTSCQTLSEFGTIWPTRSVTGSADLLRLR